MDPGQSRHMPEQRESGVEHGDRPDRSFDLVRITARGIAFLKFDHLPVYGQSIKRWSVQGRNAPSGYRTGEVFYLVGDTCGSPTAGHVSSMQPAVPCR